jgi:hypothetical protein
MSATSCSVSDSTSRSVASRWAGVNPVSVNMSAAFLYSWRWAACTVTPTLSSAPRTNGISVATPVRPTSPDGWSHTSENAEAR